MSELNLEILQIVVALTGLMILLFTSSAVVRLFMNRLYHKEITEVAMESDASKSEADTNRETTNRVTTGRIIGKCENVLIILLMFLQAYTALAIIFTAKTIIRKEDIQKNSMYFLVGTMINVTYSIVIGFLIMVINTLIKKGYFE